MKQKIFHSPFITSVENLIIYKSQHNKKIRFLNWKLHVSILELVKPLHSCIYCGWFIQWVLTFPIYRFIICRKSNVTFMSKLSTNNMTFKHQMEIFIKNSEVTWPLAFEFVSDSVAIFLQPSAHPHGPPPDKLQQVHVFLMLGAMEPNAVLPVGSHEREIEGENHFHWPAGHAYFHAFSLLKQQPLYVRREDLA